MTSCCVVTGASSGLGLAVAVELARRSREVVLVARDADRLEAARQAVEAAGGRARVARADVCDGAALTAALDEAVAETRVDLLVHAAGVLELGPVEDLVPDALRRMLEVNVLGAANTVRTMLPRLADGADAGRVAIVSSVAGLFPLPGGFTAYAASKWALRGWAETARPELARRGISLTLAYPSILDTPMVQALDERAPAVYRAFPWHPPEKAARQLVNDALRGRRESFVTTADRLAAWAAGAAPHAFASGLHAWVRWRAR